MKKTDKVIVGMSMRRSGSNAIHNFLCGLYDEPMFYIGGRVCSICNDEGHKKSIEKNEETQEMLSKYAKQINQKHFNLVIMKYEDISIANRVYSSKFICNWESIVGQSDDITFCLFLRDPFNMFASVLNQRILYKELRKVTVVGHKRIRKKIKVAGGDVKGVKKVTSVGKKLKRRLVKWKQHAKEFLGETNYLPENKLFVNYNKWNSEREYRIKIASDLGVEFREDNWNKMTTYGGGSSFKDNNVEYAENIKFNEGWKHCLENKFHFEVMKKIFEDREIVELSEKIFGHINGTEIFYK